MAQLKLDRVKIFGSKYFRSKLKLLTLPSLLARINGPKILMNSIPKAGTNLMERTLMLFPGIVFSGHRTILDWNALSARSEKKIRRIRRGQFENAHLPAHNSLLELVARNDIRVIFMVRDPRDVIVSHAKYVSEIDTTHPSHKVVASMATDSDRLMAVIRGVDGFIAPVDELWRRYDGWFYDRNTLVVRFEDLIGERGGGNKIAQLRVVASVSSHLGIDLGREKRELIASAVFSSNSPTFRKGVIGGWRDYFTSEHVEEFKSRTGDLLVRLGYEASGGWE